MAKFNPWGAKPYEPKHKSKTFTFDGQEIILVQQQLSNVEEYRALDKGLELTEKHVLNEEGDNDPEPFFDRLTGEGIEVSRMLFLNCASIAEAQPKSIKQEDRYSVEELVGISNKVDKKTWRAITTFAKSVQGKDVEEVAKNASGRQDTPES